MKMCSRSVFADDQCIPGNSPGNVSDHYLSYKTLAFRTSYKWGIVTMY